MTNLKHHSLQASCKIVNYIFQLLSEQDGIHDFFQGSYHHPAPVGRSLAIRNHLSNSITLTKLEVPVILRSLSRKVGLAT